MVFPGRVLETERGIRVYYGAADDKICSAENTWDALWEAVNA